MEIKSSEKVDERAGSALERFSRDWKGKVETRVCSRDTQTKKIGKTFYLSWEEGLKEAALGLGHNFNEKEKNVMAYDVENTQPGAYEQEALKTIYDRPSMPQAWHAQPDLLTSPTVITD